MAILSEKELPEFFIVYKLLILMSAFICAVIFSLLSQQSLNVYDFTSSNLSVYIAPSVIYLIVIHMGVENLYIKLYMHAAFIVIAYLISILIIIYELVFCFINFNFILMGYYSWAVCHLFSIAGTIIYIVVLFRISKSLHTHRAER